MLYSNAIKKGIIAGASICALALVLYTLIGVTTARAAVSINGPRDCDNNAVMYCGALSTTELLEKYTANQPGDIPAIYNHFGISRADVENLSNKTSVGTVRADGTVWVDGTLVGVNARTAGRNRTTNSSAVPNSNAFSRPPSDSFASQNTSIQIFIGYDNGAPKWGIISSCGNPLTWDSPSIDLQQQVRRSGDTQWQTTVNANTGDHLEFQLTVSENTGLADVQNVVVSDTLPSDLVFQPNTLQVDGRTQNYPSSGIISIGTLPKGSDIHITFEVMVAYNTPNCMSKRTTNTARVRGFGVVEDTESTVVTIAAACVSPEVIDVPPVVDPVEPIAPPISCHSLQLDTLNITVGEKVNMTINTSPDGSNVDGYILKSNGTQIVETNSSGANRMWFRANRAGQFRLSAYIKTSQGPVSSSACKAIVTASIDTSPAGSVGGVVCESLNIDSLAGVVGEKIYMDVSTIVEGGDSPVTGYVLRANGYQIAETNSEEANEMWFRANKEGRFNVTMYVKTANDAISSPACSSTIIVTNEN